MHDNVPFHPRTIRSFVKRTGRMTEGQKQARSDYWARYGLELQQAPPDLDAVFGRNAPRVLEIGFGMGESLVAMAQANPGMDYIGVEVHSPGIGNILKLAALAGIDNLRLYECDAKDVLQQAIRDDSLDRIQVFFPDPWHKKRHHKRRLIQPEFVQTLRERLRTGGVLHLATDWKPYALQMMEVLTTAPGYRNCCGEGQWALDHGRPETKFQRRGQRLGHGVWDLLFERVPS